MKIRLVIQEEWREWEGQAGKDMAQVNQKAVKVNRLFAFSGGGKK